MPAMTLDDFRLRQVRSRKYSGGRRVQLPESSFLDVPGSTPHLKSSEALSRSFFAGVTEDLLSYEHPPPPPASPDRHRTDRPTFLGFADPITVHNILFRFPQYQV